MDFFSIILFIGLYYIRPHDWIPVFKILPIIKLTVVMALFSMYEKHRGELRDKLLVTPHDWMMLFYFLWLVGTSPQKWTTFTQVYNLFTFYFVTAVTVSSVRRMQTFFNWWAVFIVAVAAFALMSKYGFDPTESVYLTQVTMKGRLALNTSIFNNANALGHSVVPVLVMLYFIGIWKRPVVVKLGTTLVMLIPAYCVYATVSKGAMLTGCATMLVAVMFRRPLMVQAAILLVALTAGITLVNHLPRMEELQSSKSNEAIQGRVAAFTFGLNTMKNNFTGVGWAQFEKRLYQKLGFLKSPHSSYVRVGCELGRVGLFLFLGILYCCSRTLLFARTETDEEERIRRTLFVILVSYAVSSWMVGWADRATFFLMAGVASGFHRYLQEKTAAGPVAINVPAPTVTIDTPPTPALPAVPAIGPMYGESLAFPGTALPTGVATTHTEINITPVTQAEKHSTLAAAEEWIHRIESISWKRIGIVDIVAIAILTQATAVFWSYAMKKM